MTSVYLFPFLLLPLLLSLTACWSLLDFRGFGNCTLKLKLYDNLTWDREVLEEVIHTNNHWSPSKHHLFTIEDGSSNVFSTKTKEEERRNLKDFVQEECVVVVVMLSKTWKVHRSNFLFYHR